MSGAKANQAKNAKKNEILGSRRPSRRSLYDWAGCHLRRRHRGTQADRRGHDRRRTSPGRHAKVPPPRAFWLRPW
eukprot:CAMPEP_0119491902 /NCGR_PEP_ID=MMETSP1344-20130328/16625_1 /TAXON_ID=236787 /ORGANISM="Florenciella parvula, Strain CCMP2471" /LENGTH=74 /DNA_ID=CAMNT_0007527195 /DNA_START=131 /DNA_END=355 /DNA_ORIENTATION=+